MNANVALGTSMATYCYWIENENVDVLGELDRALTLLALGVSEEVLRER